MKNDSKDFYKKTTIITILILKKKTNSELNGIILNQ